MLYGKCYRCYLNKFTRRVYRATAPRFTSMPSPGRFGMASISSAFKSHGVVAISSIKGDPVNYSTRLVWWNAEANCKSLARPSAVLHPCEINCTPFSCAIHPIRRSSEILPTLVTSG